MVAIFINLISIAFSIWVVYHYLKKENNIIIYFFLLSLFFVIIPIFVDSIGINFLGQNYIQIILNNNSEMYNINFLDSEINLKFTLFVFGFNLLLFLSYKLFTYKLDGGKYSIKKQSFYSSFVYILLGLFSVILFFIHKNIDVFNSITIILFNFFSIGYVIGIVPILRKKCYFQFIILFLPTLFFALTTGSRALFVSFFLIFFYSLLDDFEKNKHVLLRAIYIVGLILILIPLFNSFRKGSLSLSYPFWRDVCVGDGYFAFAGTFYHQFANGIIRLIQTGLPYISESMNYYDITKQLADERFFIGWGSIHPTAYGWLFIDLQWYGILTAIYFALFISFIEYIKYFFRKYKIVSMLIAFELVFLIIFIRGSVQYAYSTVIYPIIIIFLLVLLYSFCNSKIIKTKFKN